MTEKYRLMIYFAHSTMMLYSKHIHCHKGMSVDNFIKVNPLLIQRVCEEAKNLFNYELSMEQIARASHGYLAGEFKPQSVSDTEAYRITKDNTDSEGE